MKLVGIDIGKHKHFVSIVDKLTGEVILQPVAFSNNAQGFEFLISQIALYPVDRKILVIIISLYCAFFYRRTTASL